MWEFIYKTKEVVKSKTGITILSASILGGMAAGIAVPMMNREHIPVSDVVAYNRNGTSGTYEVWKDFVSPGDKAQKWAKNVLEVSGNDKMAANTNSQEGSIGYVAGASVKISDFSVEHRTDTRIGNTNITGVEATPSQAGMYSYSGQTYEIVEGQSILPTFANISNNLYEGQRNFNSLWRGEVITYDNQSAIDLAYEAINANSISGAANYWTQLFGSDITEDQATEGLAWIFFNYIDEGEGTEVIKAKYGTAPHGREGNFTYEEVQNSVQGLNSIYKDLKNSQFYSQGSTSVLETTSGLAREFSTNQSLAAGFVMPEITKSGGSQFVGFLNNSGHEGSGDAFKAERLSNTYIGFQSREAKQEEWNNIGIKDFTPTPQEPHPIEYTVPRFYRAYTIDPLIIIASKKGFNNWDYKITMDELYGIYVSGETTISDLSGS